MKQKYEKRENSEEYNENSKMNKRRKFKLKNIPTK